MVPLMAEECWGNSPLVVLPDFYRVAGPEVTYNRYAGVILKALFRHFVVKLFFVLEAQASDCRFALSFLLHPFFCLPC